MQRIDQNCLILACQKERGRERENEDVSDLENYLFYIDSREALNMIVR